MFVRLCFFSDLLFKGGGSRGLVYLEAKLVLVRWLASAFLSLCFCFSFAYSPIFLPWVFFFPLFSCVCSSSVSPSVCIVHSLCSVCPLCACPLFLFLFILCLSPGSFLFSFLLFSFFTWPPPACCDLSLAFIRKENAMCSCLGNGMHRGGEKDVTVICCGFR